MAQMLARLLLPCDVNSQNKIKRITINEIRLNGSNAKPCIKCVQRNCRMSFFFFRCGFVWHLRTALHLVFHSTFSSFCFHSILVAFFSQAKSILFVPQTRASNFEWKKETKIKSRLNRITSRFLYGFWCACTCCHRCFVQFDRHNHKPISLCCIQTHFYAFIFSCFELSHFCLYKLRNKKGDRRKEYEENHSFRQSRYLIQAFLFGANGAPKIILNILLHVWCFGFLGFWLRVRPSLPCRCKHRFVVHLSLCH